MLVVLPNFGDEKGVADTLKLSGLNVPVLVQAYPDDLDQLGVARRRDAFCGKISVCNNLVQAGIKFTLTEKHVSDPKSDGFQADFDRFLRICRVVKGLRGVRLGAVGARPGAFNTVRYSEKILERNGISVTTVDLSEILGKAGKIQRRRCGRRWRSSTRFAAMRPRPNVPTEKLTQMARLGVVLSRWMEANALDATAIQCWTSVQQNFGCNVCTLMSMMSERFMPSACEVDVTGVLTMYAMQLACRIARGDRRLEQQLRRRRRQVCVVSLRQLGEELSAGYQDCQRADPWQHARRGEHVRRPGRPHAGRSADLRPRYHGRRRRMHSRVRRRRRANRRRVKHVWHSGRRPCAAVAAAAAPHL